MPRPRLPWIKLWCDMLADAKMLQLTIGERGCFVMMLLAAQQSPVRGALALTASRPMTVEEIGDTIGLKNGDMPTLRSAIEKLLSLDCLALTPDKLVKVTHFLDRQNVYQSDMRNYHKQPAFTPDKLLNTPVEVEVEGRREKKNTPPIIPLKGDIPSREKTAPGQLTFGEFNNVHLPKEEYDKLLKQFGEVQAKALIERLSGYVESKGVKYKSHYATILNWARRDNAGGNNGINQGHPRPTGLPGNQPGGAFDDLPTTD